MLAKATSRSLAWCLALALGLALAFLLLTAAPAAAQGPYIDYVSHDITRDSINSDGVANPGEWIYFSVTVQNTGSYTAYLVQGSLYTTDYLAECFGATQLGNLGPGQQATSEDDLYCNLSALTPDEHVIDFTLWLTDDEGHQYFPSFTETVVDNVGPALSDALVTPKVGVPGDPVTITAQMLDGAGVAAVTGTVRSADNTFLDAFPMYDDGHHGDGKANDDVYGAYWTTPGVSYDFVCGFEAEDGLGNFREHPDAFGFTNRPFSRHSTILVVIDELTEPGYDDYYTSALAANGFAYDLWHPFYRGPVPSDTILDYVTGIVIWAAPEQGLVNDPYDSSARDTLLIYLDEGGKLFITGQDIGYYLHEQIFYTDYLHAQFVEDNVGLFAIRGIAGDEIGDGMDFTIAGTGTGAQNQQWPSEINPREPAERVFEYYVPEAPGGLQRVLPKLDLRKPQIKTEKLAPEGIRAQGVVSSGTAAIRVETEDYKVVYFAFGFEGIDDVDDRNAVMGSVVEWLHGRSTFERQLPVGWNLLSLPVIPESRVISDVLTSIAGKYTLVQTYDAATGGWKSYDPALPGGSDLQTLDEARAFWILMSEPGTLVVPGLLPILTDQELKEGWNLVAYPCSEQRTVSNALVSIGGKYTQVLGFNAADPSPWYRYNIAVPGWANRLVDMTPGWGYWVYTTEDCQLTIVN